MLLENGDNSFTQCRIATTKVQILKIKIQCFIGIIKWSIIKSGVLAYGII
jgi:hypothetical protein